MTPTALTNINKFNLNIKCYKFYFLSTNATSSTQKNPPSILSLTQGEKSIQAV